MLAIEARFVSVRLALTPNQDSNFSPLRNPGCVVSHPSLLFYVGFCFRCSPPASVFIYVESKVSSYVGASVLSSVGAFNGNMQARFVSIFDTILNLAQTIPV